MTTVEDRVDPELPDVDGRIEHSTHEGDSELTWNTRNAAEVDAARELFNSLKAKRYLAYRVTGDGTTGEVMTEFDPRAGRVIMQPQNVGG